jgi:lipopolysaccharide/colanic/teichoic acid biosynthesis glycosyltransferase
MTSRIIDSSRVRSLSSPPRSSLLDSRFKSASKRAFDIAFAVVLIVLALPVLLSIAVAVKLSSRGSFFFLHERIGRDGRTFKCMKFRTMRADETLSAADVERFKQRFKLDQDPRVTPLGRLLRRTSLDELPQLFNVLGGSMSVVGPRPLISEELDQHYSREQQEALLSVRPGLTGPWQLSGSPRAEYPERTMIELSYLTAPGARRDLMMIVRTILSVCTMRGSG